MTPTTRRSVPALRVALVATALCAFAGCRSGTGTAPEPAAAAGERAVAEAPSPAADPIIEKARTPEEKRALEKARDEVDAEMREKARALDEEIGRLRKENEQLKAAGAAADARPKTH